MRGGIANGAEPPIINGMALKTLVLFFLCNAVIAAVEGKGLPTGPSSIIEKRLKNNKFPKSFIKQLLKNYDASKREQVIKLNVMGFLLSPDYSGHISPVGIQRSREFLKKHADAFATAEKKYGVKKEIIVSLLWVESRLGENHGGFHVPSVYLSLLLGDSDESTHILMEELARKQPNPSRAMINKTKSRAKIKGRWAIGELWAIYKMNRKHPSTVATLKGSYSGAFGFSQFLPSSYVQWGKSYSQKKTPDLYDPRDAIISVAYYLSKNGYKKGKVGTYKKALFRYNKSNDYGDAILKLSAEL